MTSEANYLIRRFEQGTPAWLRWRGDGIGASDAAAIMGENPWRSAEEVLAEKTGLGPPPKVNAAMRRGTQMEPLARREYIQETGNKVAPVCLEHTEHPWLRASIDGLCPAGRIVVEIKCGWSSYRDAMGQYVSDYYRPQLQHILMITGLPLIDYWAYTGPGSGILIHVERDDRYIAKLFRKEEAFWKKVEKGRAAPR